MAGGRIDILVDLDTAGLPGQLERGLKPTMGIASAAGKGLGLALVGGLVGAGFALKSIISLGNDYTGNLNSLQAVTQATGLQMQQVSKVATQLGSDLNLPATSAADAAAAMLELAKGGLTVDEAMTAAKGTLQLAAAAQIDAATAAEIQSSALNQFGLAADQAGRVADVLANTANAAAGEITDMGLALKYVGPISKSLNISIEDTAAAVGLLANNGIKGENAGTALRGVLASLAAPSKEAAGALKALGVQAFDGQGRFVGLRAVIDQLSAAQGKMTDAAFTSAAATAFGREPLAAITALAAEGAPAFDAMAKAVARSGGAAEVAAAKTKGLGGAIEGFKSQVETAGLLIYDAIDEPLERLVRSAAQRVSDLGPAVAGGIENAVAAGEAFGPSLAAALGRRAGAIGDAVDDILSPLTEGARELVNSGLNIAINLFEEFTDALRGATEVIAPVSQGIGGLAESAADAGGPIGVVTGGIDLLGNVVGVALAALVPVAGVVGNLVSAFADLPGPVQSAVIAMLALKLVRGPVDDLAGSVSGRLTGAWRGFNEEMRLQQALLTGSTSIISANVSQLGLAAAALESRSPALRALGDSYRAASEGATRFATAQGIAAASGTGLRLAGGSLVSFLGGPWGIAMGVATVGLGLLASQHQKAAEAAKRSEAGQKDFSRALIASGGAINDAIRDLAFKRADDEKAIDNAKTLGIAYADVTDAVLGQSGAYDKLQAQLRAIMASEVEFTATKGGSIQSLNEKGKAAEALLASLGLLNGEFKDGRQSAEDYAAAQRQSGGSMLDSTDSGRSLAEAMGVLSNETASADDRARALKDALDALSGNAVDYEQAISRLREQAARLPEAFAAASKEAAAAGTSILDAAGRINTTTEAGRRLLDLTDDLAVSMVEAATKAHEFSLANGDSATVALGKARDAAQSARQAFIDQAGAAGLGADAAAALADAYGLVPESVVTKLENPNFTKVQQELDFIRQRVEGIPNSKSITVQSLSDEAKQKLIDLGLTVRTLPDKRVEITASTDAARNALNGFLREPANKVVQVVYRGVESFRTPTGSIYNARGGLVAAMAGGGMLPGRPIKAGLAAVVPPNTLRYIGDRIRDDEAYIPINRAKRSQDILELTARRMGYALVRTYAEGGMAASSPSSSASSLPPNRGAASVDAGLHVQNLYVTDVEELIRRQEQHRAMSMMRAGLTG